MPDLILVALFTVVGVLVGWQSRALIAERDECRREEQRDAEWDTKHLGGDRA